MTCRGGDHVIAQAQPAIGRWHQPAAGHDRHQGIDRLALPYERLRFFRGFRVVEIGGLVALPAVGREQRHRAARQRARSEEHTSELQSLMRSSYAVFSLKQTLPDTLAPYLSRLL